MVRETDLIAGALDLEPWTDVMHAAAALHDVGKAHDVFQSTVRPLIDRDAFPDRDETLWGKSGSSGGHSRPHFCHELVSALAIDQLDGALDVGVDDLLVYLIASHHGRIRLSIRPAAGEDRPGGVASDARFARGVVEGETLPAVDTALGTVPRTILDLRTMELGDDRSWSRRMLTLRDDPQLGPFRLGLLEAVLRVADWRASA